MPSAGQKSKAFKYWIPGLLLVCAGARSAHAQNASRPVTVSDVIEMTRLGDPVYLQGGPSKGRVASFSPDGNRFIVPIVKGNLKNNTNEYSLLLFETAHIFEDGKPLVLLTLASSSNRPAIRNIRWLDDQSIAFLGESRGELPQVYHLDLQTKNLQRLTQHATSVVEFDIASDGKTILYAADRAPRQLANSDVARRNGIVVDNTTFLRLLGTAGSGYDPTATEGEELYLKVGSEAPTPVSIEDRVFAQGALSFAPGGRHAVIATYSRRVPNAWFLYKDRRLQELVAAEQSGDTTNTLRRYSLLDVEARTVTPLFDAPSDGRKSAFRWTTDGQSIVVSGTYLPLDALDETENQRRMTNSYVVEVKLPGRSYAVISEKDLKVTDWNPGAGSLPKGSGGLARDGRGS